MMPPIVPLVVATPVLVLVGLGMGSAPFLFMAGAMAFLASAAWAFGNETVRRLTCERTVHARAFEKQQVEVRIGLANRSGLPLLGVNIEDRFLPQDMLPKETAVPRDIRPHRRVTAAYTAVCTRHRGQYALGPLAATFHDPVGLLQRRVCFPGEATFSVLPLPLPLARLGLDGRSTILSSATPDQQARGESLKFYGVREYRPGDPLRYVHWKASARLGRLVVKQFEASVSTQITVFLDLARASLAGLGAEATTEYGIRAVASIAAASVSLGHEIQLFGQGDATLTTTMAGGEAHLGYLLERLATIKPKGTIPLPELVTDHAERVPQGSHVFLIIAGLACDAAAYARAMYMLRGRHAQVAAIIVDDRTFVQHERWKKELPAETWPPLATLLAGMGAQVRLLGRGQDLAARLGER